MLLEWDLSGRRPVSDNDQCQTEDDSYQQDTREQHQRATDARARRSWTWLADELAASAAAVALVWCGHYDGHLWPGERQRSAPTGGRLVLQTDSYWRWKFHTAGVWICRDTQVSVASVLNGFGPCMLLWPWPCPDNLHIIWQTDRRTYRKADWIDRNYKPRRFAGGQKLPLTVKFNLNSISSSSVAAKSTAKFVLNTSAQWPNAIFEIRRLHSFFV